MSFLVGLIGSGIGRSGSPALHESEGEALGLKIYYQLMELSDPAQLPALLESAERVGFAGVNITHPFKQAVIPYLTELSADARAVGAANTVKFLDGRRIGYNTDCTGFQQSFERGLAGVGLGSVLQVGAGGAGSAVAYAALKLGVARLAIFDRDVGRAEGLVERLRAQFDNGRVMLSSGIKESLQGADGLIHATPVGMDGHPGCAVDAALLRPELWVAEVVYFPLETELLRLAKARGCRTLDGGGMAVFQAADAFHLFTGVAPDAERMLEGFRRRSLRG
jgi:shikimate dehydrogenase